MEQYIVRSGQNIFDVALTLYGNVEGVFDLLASNPGLAFNTTLKNGLVLNYHKEFVFNPNIVSWINDSAIRVKNGHHHISQLTIEERIRQHIADFHSDIYNSLHELSVNAFEDFWNNVSAPRIVIKHQGQLAAINVILKEETHLIIDWGDYSDIEIFDSNGLLEIEHCYKGSDSHKITIYGDFKCQLLDFTNLNGVYYPLTEIIADTFITPLNIQDLNTLIITQ